MIKKFKIKFQAGLLQQGLQSWQKRKHRKKLMLYHLKPRSDNRNQVARTLDFLAGVLIFWLLVLTTLVAIMPVVPALFASLFLAAVVGVAGRRLHKGRKRRQLQHHRMWAVGQKCRLEIENLKTREELAIFVGSLLTRLPQFEDVRVNPKGKITIYARYRGSPVAVQCLLPASSRDKTKEEEQALNAVLIQQLSIEVAEQGCKNALIVAVGEVPSAIRWLIGRLRENCRVALLTGEKLVELALQARQQAGGEERYEDVRQPEKYGAPGMKEVVLGRKKGLTYLIAVFVLGTFYLISKPAGLLGNVYLIFMTVNFMLALMCFASGWKRKGIFELE